MRRRDLLKSTALGALALALHPVLALGEDQPAAPDPFAALERAHGGRLGVAILDTATGRRYTHRGNERFLLCSTSKLPLVAAVLARVDHGDEQLDRRIVYGSSVVLDWAPVTKLYTGAPGLTVAELCEAAITMSDNTAANLLFHAVGGPGAVTRYVRSLGDAATQFDRTEPALNRLDGLLDTTTPSAMIGDMQKLLLGDALTDASRARLLDWLQHCQTGAYSLRAGLPAGWREGDKTGSNGAGGTLNDVAIVWPPSRKPLLVAAYYDHAAATAAQRSAALAAAGRIVGTL